VKVLVTGSRGWTDARAIRKRFAALPDDTIVITGQADGADSLARAAALQRQLWVVDVPVLRPHWRRHGRSAGFKRNRVMLDLSPDVVLAFWDGKSPGTKGCIEEAIRLGVPVEVA